MMFVVLVEVRSGKRRLLLRERLPKRGVTVRAVVIVFGEASDNQANYQTSQQRVY